MSFLIYTYHRNFTCNGLNIKIITVISQIMDLLNGNSMDSFNCKSMLETQGELMELINKTSSDYLGWLDRTYSCLAESMDSNVPAFTQVDG